MAVMVENDDSLPDAEGDYSEEIHEDTHEDTHDEMSDDMSDEMAEDETGEGSRPVFTDEPEEKESLGSRLMSGTTTPYEIFLFGSILFLAVGFSLAIFGWYKSLNDRDTYGIYLTVGLFIMLFVLLILAIFLLGTRMVGGVSLFKNIIIKPKEEYDDEEEDDDDGYYPPAPKSGTPPAPSPFGAYDHRSDELTEEEEPEDMEQDQLEELEETEDEEEERDDAPEPHEGGDDIIMPRQ